MSLNPIASNADYAATTQRISKLNAALSKVRGRIYEIKAQLSVDAFAADEPGDSRVLAALEFAKTGIVKAGNQPETLREEHSLLVEQERALEDAIAGLEQARQRQAQQLSADACTNMLDEHKRIAEEMLEVLVKFDQLQQDELKLHRRLHSSGYDVYFRETAALWPQVGLLSERSGSLLWYRVQELTRYLGRDVAAKYFDPQLV